MMPLLLEQGEEIDFFLCMCSRNCIIIIVIINIIVYITVVVVCQNRQVNELYKCKHEISDSLHYSIFFILFCYTKLRTDPHVNKDFFLFEFFSKDSLSCSKVLIILNITFYFFSRVKVHAPLSSADVKCLLNQRREAKFVIASFL